MSSIEVIGGGKNQRKLTEDAACFAVRKLFPKARKYDIEINLNSKYDNCFEYDDRIYKININKKQSEDDFLTAIFHEITHVKQYIYDNLLNNYNFSFDGSGSSLSIVYDDYINHPAEKEAYKMQEILLKLWKRKN
tara:strand:- start:269 stop:673 length:405 start_codon:yes stop_codon:yes gene_type:complete